MAKMESVHPRNPSLPTDGIITGSVSNDDQHLHGVEVDALYVHGARVHVDRRAVGISLPRHLMESSSGEVDVPRVKKSHHAHRMVRWTHDGSRWCFAWWRARHGLLNVGLVVLHCVLLRRWRRWCGWWTHVGLRFDSAFDAGPTDWVAAFLKL